MGQKTPLSVSFNLPDGREVSIETGKLATQAHGSVVIRMGKTMLFCSVCASEEIKEGQSFFPLSVDYQEKFASSGRIPGNFFKRESRLSNYEVLICRLVDRVLRPLFPDGFLNETQVMINLISVDKQDKPDALAALAASAALAVSNIPFDGPISEVRVARVDGKFIINPRKDDLEKADLNIIVGATDKDVMMVEGEGQEMQEADLIEAIRFGHEAIKVQCAAQLELAQLVGDKCLIKREKPVQASNEELAKEIDALIGAQVRDVAKSSLGKDERKARFKAIKEEMKLKLAEAHDDEYLSENKELISKYHGKVQKHHIRDVVLTDGIRLDGRKSTDVRPIWTEVDYLPSAHGSAIFNRGETQALCTVTVGTKHDESLVDTALEYYYERFYLHYNFPAYSVGEVRPNRGPGRREVGHANLAARSLKQVMPKDEDLAYTVRIVSDIMESNGSSSMATVCGGSMALMDAGIPIRKPVSGIAMGMISDDKGRVAILSDILGDEDHIGDMDFKVTGTDKGICACQMDIKIDGLPYEQLEKALMQAREGRLHILNEMSNSISSANAEMKPHAPRIHRMLIDKTYIGAVIGPGGKIIQEMQAETKCTINIDEDERNGIVTIFGEDKESVQKAIERISSIAFTPEVGDVFDSKVASIMPYGIFVDFKGKSGLVHISELSHKRLEKIEDSNLSQGDSLQIKLIGVDSKTGKFRLSHKALTERPQGMPEEKNRGPRN